MNSGNWVGGIIQRSRCLICPPHGTNFRGSSPWFCGPHDAPRSALRNLGQTSPLAVGTAGSRAPHGAILRL